jgi:hypothetical protein
LREWLDTDVDPAGSVGLAYAHRPTSLNERTLRKEGELNAPFAPEAYATGSGVAAAPKRAGYGTRVAHAVTP